jgi:hypothetical protein
MAPTTREGLEQHLTRMRVEAIRLTQVPDAD